MAISLEAAFLGKQLLTSIGHGGQTKDLEGDDADGYDEVIYPVDFRQTSHITDDEMHRIMVQPLPAGVRLTAIFDSCHSATALDLPYVYSTQGMIKEPSMAREAGQGLLTVVSACARNDLDGAGDSIVSVFKKAATGEAQHQRAIATKSSAADVVMFSGSKDNQTSYVSSLFSWQGGLLTETAPIPLSHRRRQAPCRGPSSRL